jgi:NO-binding membrane sensor protein with MHYT domain
MHDWLSALRRYVGTTAIGHLAWEVLQLPLYEIWEVGRTGEIAFAVIHCSGGDLLIAIFALSAALILAGTARWPAERFAIVAALTIAFGVAYMFYSEWLNMNVRGSWSYSPRMPLLPPLGTGLAPVLQWLVVPLLAFAVTTASRRRSGRMTRVRLSPN